MKILAIDTSTDETSVAVTEGTRILSSVISSQVRYHKKYGGVVPMLAGRLHEQRIDSVVELALRRATLTRGDIDAIAVTHGPGLAPALQVGIAKAKALAAALKLPLYGVNHMAGHISSCFARTGGSKRPLPQFPALAVLVSGGHSELVRMEAFGQFKILGQTLDDALGEAYDKTGRMLGLGYPGGQIVAEFAELGEPRYTLPVPMLRSGDLNLSYSGLKNAVRLLINELKGGDENKLLTKQQIVDICASFEEVAQASLLHKVEHALKENAEFKQLILAGGVAANTALRTKLRNLAKEYNVELVVPISRKLCTDNAAMIGVAAYFGIEQGQKPVDPDHLDRLPSLSIEVQEFTKQEK